MMEIITTIKQVPDTSKITVNKETGTLIRKGVPSVLNPYCEWAIETALSLKEITNATLTVLTMGPPAAKNALIRSLALGADSATLLTDKKFAGSDCRATAYVLACAITTINSNVDIIITGKQAIDGDTAQVPAELSVFLDMPFIPDVISIESSEKGAVILTREEKNGEEKIRVKTPFVCSVSNGFRTRRLPSLSNTLRALSTKIERLSAENIGCKTEMIGLTGSPTKVIKIENIVTTRVAEKFHWESISERKEALKRLANIL
jgi:electron transfer flavoprotein beta subunit